ncbi:MAG: hypothetical protein R6U32_07495 [Candidatus Woesearchaeota archaeon]
MFIKRADRKDCVLECSRKEIAEEFAFQSTAVIERLALDANLLFYDLASEAMEAAGPIFSKSSIYWKLHWRIRMGTLYPERRFSRLSALISSMMRT